MKRLVIFGTGSVGELAHHYFSTNTEYQVAAFTVDPEFVGNGEFCGLPVTTFDQIATHYPPPLHDMFVAVGYARVNQVRKQKYLAARAMGYHLTSYISPRATILTKQPIGQNCFILEDNTIQPFAKIGNNVTLWSGNHIGHHSTIGDHCFISSHVVVSGGVIMGESCFIGVNATLRDHITIGDKCVIGAGTLILADTEPEGVYAEAGSERSRVPSSRLKKI